jgi:transposase
MVAEASNKQKKGFTVGKKPKDGESRKQVKYTMGYDGFAVRLADIFNETKYLSEDVAMPSLLLPMIKKENHHANIYVLDRGLSAVYNYETISGNDALFVGRLRTDKKVEHVRSLMTDNTDRSLGKLELVDDIEVRLYDSQSKQFTQRTYRIVKARFKVPRDTTRNPAKGKHPRVENEIYFITNDFSLSPQEVAEAYRRRWDIEVFFRFLKQELNFSHFLSVSENGLRIILYMTLITAMLVMIYKRLNGLGYSEAKFGFRIEMCDYIMVLGIYLSGGDTTRYANRYKIRELPNTFP